MGSVPWVRCYRASVLEASPQSLLIVSNNILSHIQQGFSFSLPREGQVLPGGQLRRYRHAIQHTVFITLRGGGISADYGLLQSNIVSRCS